MKKQSLKLTAIFKAIERFAHRHPDWTIREMTAELRRLDLLELELMAQEQTRQYLRKYKESRERRGETQKLIFTYNAKNEEGNTVEMRTSVEHMNGERAKVVMDLILQQIQHDVASARKTHSLFRKQFGREYPYYDQPYLDGLDMSDDDGGIDA